MIESYGIINDRSPHLVADLCEIICYFENRQISRADIEVFLSEYGGEGLFDDLQVEDLDSARANEKFQELSEEVFRHLSYRETAFARYYPFTSEGDVLVPAEDMSQHQKSYAALLAFSRLKMFSRSVRNQFALDFERFCVEASLGFTGDWNVLHFGKGGRDRPKFGTKLKDALLKLSEVLREYPVELEIREICEGNTGDAGVDIVIYKDWNDDARAVPAYFAQCAAQQTNWPEKRYESNSLSLEKYFHFFHKPGTILFIPLCFRGVDGQWISSDGHQTVLVDRKRLLELIESRIRQDGSEDKIVEGIPKPFELGCASINPLEN